MTDYAHFGSIIKKLLLYRHQKNVQYEMTFDSIESKKVTLEQLEKAELEARRLEGALAAAGVPRRREGEASEADAGGLDESGMSASGSTAATQGGGTGGMRKSASSGGSGSGYGFLSALSHSITGMIDVHPEETRRNNISKTRDSIAQVRPPACSARHR